jgi:hypothetical protein
MKKFEICFHLDGCIEVDAENYLEAEKSFLKKLEQYKKSMELHFKSKIELGVDDIEEVS